MTTIPVSGLVVGHWYQVETMADPSTGEFGSLVIDRTARKVVAEHNATQSMRRGKGYWPEHPRRSVMHAAYRHRRKR